MSSAIRRPDTSVSAAASRRRSLNGSRMSLIARNEKFVRVVAMARSAGSSRSAPSNSVMPSLNLQALTTVDDEL